MPVSSRHLRRGTARCYWTTAAIANTSAPTVAEVTNDDDLTASVQSVNDWLTERTLIELPTVDDYGFLLSTQAPQRLPAAPSIVLYDEGSATAALLTSLAEHTKGYIVFALDGAAANGDRADVWPVISLGPQQRITYDLEPASWLVSFSLWDRPTEGATIAA